MKYLLLCIWMAITLTACGGGSSSGDNQVNNNDDNDVPVVEIEAEPVLDPEPESFTVMANELFNTDEDSEPMDISSLDINSDADDELTDSSKLDEKTAFSSMMTDKTK